MTTEAGAKIAAFHRGRKRPPQTGAAISKKLKGKPKSPEHVEAQRQALLAFWERRRQQGLPLTHRTESGHRKHSEAMLARGRAARVNE